MVPLMWLGTRNSLVPPGTDVPPGTVMAGSVTWGITVGLGSVVGGGLGGGAVGVAGVPRPCGSLEPTAGTLGTGSLNDVAFLCARSCTPANCPHVVARSSA